MSTTNYVPYTRSYKENVELVLQVMKQKRVTARYAMTFVSMPKTHFGRMEQLLEEQNLGAEKRCGVVEEALMKGASFRYRIKQFFKSK